MASSIDPTKPTTTTAYTADVRANFAAAKSEIEALQAGTGLADGAVTTSKIADDAVTDAKIGDRTIDPALAGGASTGTLTQLLSWIGKTLKAISGETNWWDTPTTTLKSHVANVSNPHSVTKTQVGLGNVDNVQQQPLDADLTAIAALGSAADQVPYATGVGTWALTALTSLARTIIGRTTSSDIRSDIGAAASGANSDVTALTALTSGTPFRKNAILNGDFQVWQTGTSFAAMGGTQYIADNWQYSKSGAMVHTGSRSTDVPTIAQAGRKIPYSLLIDCTTVDAALAAGDYAAVTTYIEGYNFVHIAGVGLCHQFWHKHTKTGTYCVGYANSIGDRSFVREYTQAVADTWEFATVLVDASPTAGTWDYTNGLGLSVTFTLAAGTNFQTTAGAWQTGNLFATANQVNACDDVANNFMLAGVQLEKGSVATEFDVRTYQETLAACQRYLYRIDKPSNASGVLEPYCSGQVWTSNFQGHLQFPVQMRSAPTFTSSSAASFQSHVPGVATTTLSSLAMDTASVDGARLAAASTYAGTQGLAAQLTPINSTATFMQFSARF